MISWEPGYGAISYNIYISTSPEIDEAADFAGSTTDPNYAVPEPLVPGMTYYWRVDCMDIGLNTYTGDVWQLSALDILAHFPVPADGAVWQDTTEVSFTPGLGAAVHHIYFSADKALVDDRDPSVATMFSLLTTLNVGELEDATTYYWAVDEFIVPDTVAGPTWSFTTLDPIISGNVDSWMAVAAGAAPGYLATHLADGVYDIGEYTGDQTYEFLVISDPCETQASMGLIGRRGFGDSSEGIKYEQWNNTGTYGATIFGVVDYDFGVPTAPGEYTHLAFVSDANSTTVFVDGVEGASIDSPISLSGLVGIGYIADAIDGSASFDDFDGSIFGVAVYDKALSAAEIEKNANAFFNPIAITDPNLVLQYVLDTAENGIVPDASGHSNFGTIMGDPQFVMDGGNTVLDFDGVDDYIYTGLSASDLGIGGNGARTVTSWVLTRSFDNGGIYDVGNRSGGQDFCLRTLAEDNRWRIQYWGGDLDFDLESKDQWVHFAHVHDGAFTQIYANGELIVDWEKTIDTPDTNPFQVGVYGWQNDYFDGLISDIRVYDKALTEAEVAAVILNIADVTAPGDVVIGDPNDGNWPGGEIPAYAVDNTLIFDSGSSSKFLHFGGATGPTGFVVVPAVGPTVVQGLTLTTANDEPPRDPASYEVYGSNGRHDGPWNLIASGDVVDFTQADAYPRYTKNATPITFENAVAYTYYKVMFPTIRDAASANSMQIAEVELLGNVAPMYSETFESYAAGDNLEGVNGWSGWGGPAASADVSDTYAYSGTNSVEITGGADLVQEFELSGGTFVLTAMMYIPSGTTGTTYFILMNQYGAVNDWSTQTQYNMDTGAITPWSGAQDAITIQYDQWVQIKCEVDLDNNTVVEYYNGVQIDTRVWDDGASGLFGAIDLYGNGASSVYYDDIVVD